MCPKLIHFGSVIGLLSLFGCTGCNDGARTPPASEKRGGPAVIAESDRDHQYNHSTIEARSPRRSPVYSKDVAPILEKYCLECHDAGGAEGGINLEELSDDLSEKHVALLPRVAANLRSESMPPEGEPRPDAAELEIIHDWIDSASSDVRPRSGRIALHRLNRAQYNNTVRDLTGLDLRPADEFPSDDSGYGFDNIGGVLSTPPILVEMYLAAAEKLIDAVFQSPDLRARIMNPPADLMPLVFRRYQPPVRSPREFKVLRTTPVAVDPEMQRQQRIYNILRAFADRAYRRPSTHDELTRLLDVVISAEKDGESLESAHQGGRWRPCWFRRIFCSSGLSPRRTPAVPLPDQDFGLAARLSYFLWSSMPDDELLRLASSADLRRPSILESQVKRMLRDPRSRALSEQFAGQWLQTRKLAAFRPDPQLFPEFDEALQTAMERETELFFASIQDEDRSVLDLLDADYSFVNERLARHYGLPGVEGERFRRVSLRGTARGGVVTMASVLTATSNPTRTSPVKRGRWILENILGAPPSPPPDGVEALAETASLAGSHTLRQQMEQHRRNPACASCHRQMDPLGFALENFDALGSWRDQEAGQSVDSRGRLPGGRSFQGPDGLKAALSRRRDAFTRCLTEKMLTYALGAGSRPRRPPRGRPDRPYARRQRIPILRARAGDRGKRAIPEPHTRGRGAMNRHRRITRRTVLRGVGASLALPVLEAMGGRLSRGGSDAARQPPSRIAFLYVPNGVHMPDWTPRTTGAAFELPLILEPLEAVKDELLVLSGLTLNPARALGDGGGDHARAMASFLTGRHPRKTGGADLRAGKSVDQVAAEHLGHLTRFPSLEIGCEGGQNGGECDHGYSCAYQSNLAWRSESAPLAKQVNPRLVFNRLFGSTNEYEGADARARSDGRQKSILDFIAEDARRLSQNLGRSDRRKVDEYLTSVREVEQRISKARPSVDLGGMSYPCPLGIPADFEEHLRVMADLLVLAFQSDLTRIVTFVFGNDGSNRSYSSIGVPDGHHDLSHHGGDAAKQERIRKINRFHVVQLAYLLKKLKATPDGDGSLLDHSMIVYGSGISDGNTHRHDDLPILLAGKGAGTINTGRHLRCPAETPLTNLYVSMLANMGVQVDAFGDSTGALTALRG